ncbi:BEL1-like homeodomain protein 9 [Nicotiana tomentosiformis]|uniref:BEL1-like homeodomain protein 9 n=1 Tax=Nicotiana tomentosiformis TaxID=4098 RepID=UPI00051AEE54|nr:BEL1-like homeodomain protein 9 [Nicotiana tomentosiformis]
MAEGFEPYHVPQQSRRDKLRVLVDDNLQLQNYPSCLVPLYDPSIISSDLPSFQEINGTPFFYTPQNLRFLDQSIRTSGEDMVHNNNNNNTNGQGLSLSLSSLHHNTTNHDFLSKSSCVPLGPFTGYSLILKRSRFLKPAQLLLEELSCDVGREIYAEKLAADDFSLMDPSHENIVVDRQDCSNGDEHGKKKSRLILMLHEVYQRYKQYHQQLQMVVTSFESVAGLGNAAPFANLALKTMSKHFNCLKNAITDQLQFTNESRHGQRNCERDPIPRVGKGLYCQRPDQIHNNAGFADRTQPIWRPQRGLPERAVTVLRAWLFDHFLHPYPTDTDKVMLAKQTGLSRNQVSNWFINARVRLWKPMVEEIHMLETKEAHNKASQREGHNSNNNNNSIEHFPTSNSHAACETPSTSAPRLQDTPPKRTRNDFPMGNADSISLSYGNLSTGTSGVSLTLGLHQNTGIGLSEPFPINAARRFGIDANSDRFIVGGFEEQNGQFGRNFVGGQFLHDFAG